jgi:hypothetical protein
MKQYLITRMKGQALCAVGGLFTSPLLGLPGIRRASKSFAGEKKCTCFASSMFERLCIVLARVRSSAVIAKQSALCCILWKIARADVATGVLAGERRINPAFHERSDFRES